MTLTRHDNLADADLYGSYDNPMPNFVESEFNSYVEGDEYQGITVCPPEGQSKGKKSLVSALKTGHIFLTVDCWQPGAVYSNFSLYVTTNSAALWKSTPLTSLGRYEYLSALVDTAYVDTDDGTFISTQEIISRSIVLRLSWFYLYPILVYISSARFVYIHACPPCDSRILTFWIEPK